MFVRKIVVILLIMCFGVSLSYAQENRALVEKMVNSLNADNAKSVIIPGSNGVLSIYFEKANKNNKNLTLMCMELLYNDIRSTFQVENNIAITQNGILVFAQNGDKTYIKASGGSKESLAVTLSMFEYIYKKDYVIVKYRDETFKFNEALYDKQKHTFTVYDKSKYIKTVTLKQ